MEPENHYMITDTDECVANNIYKVYTIGTVDSTTADGTINNVSIWSGDLEMERDPRPAFSVDTDKIKTVEDALKIMRRWANDIIFSGVDSIEGIEQYVVGNSDELTPKEIVELRKKGVTFQEKPNSDGSL